MLILSCFAFRLLFIGNTNLNNKPINKGGNLNDAHSADSGHVIYFLYIAAVWGIVLFSWQPPWTLYTKVAPYCWWCSEMLGSRLARFAQAQGIWRHALSRQADVFNHEIVNKIRRYGEVSLKLNFDSVENEWNKRSRSIVTSYKIG